MESVYIIMYACDLCVCNLCIAVCMYVLCKCVYLCMYVICLGIGMCVLISGYILRGALSLCHRYIIIYNVACRSRQRFKSRANPSASCARTMQSPTSLLAKKKTGFINLSCEVFRCSLTHRCSGLVYSGVICT